MKYALNALEWIIKKNIIFFARKKVSSKQDFYFGGVKKKIKKFIASFLGSKDPLQIAHVSLSVCLSVCLQKVWKQQ